MRYALQEGMTVRDPETLAEVPADGETMGEIMFRGNIVMKGYLKNPTATAEAFDGGWFHTGDLAVLEPDRYVKIKDRSKDIIISGGENISSLEVEDALYRHPDVLACAVVARPDPKWGETPVAFVELRRGASVTAAELVAHCRALLAGYKVPREIRFEAIPEDLDRQDPEVRAARARPLGGGDRIDDARTRHERPDRHRHRSLRAARRDARGVVTLTLNRPQSFNALSEGMLAALQAELDAVAARRAARASSCIAAAGKAFCAGHDLKEMRADAVAGLLRSAVRAVRAA